MDRLDRDELLELITPEDIIEILKDLGCDNYKIDKDGFIFESICHGSDSHKLYYYKDSGIFKCYSCCGVLSLYDLIISVDGGDFNDAYKYLCDFKNISITRKKKTGLQITKEVNTDLDFMKFHRRKKKPKTIINLPAYDKNILNIFDKVMPMCWKDEGINEDIAYHFNVGFYFNQNKAIIPHYDIKGDLVGIRARSFNKHEVEDGKKYMPITIQNLCYRYPMNWNIYGLWQNKENIKAFKKVIVFESEKSVWLYGSLYGQENNIAVATSGTTLSLYQRGLLLALGVEEICIAYDKQYQIELMEDKSNIKEYKEFEAYVKRLIKITNMFINYCKVSVMCCWDDLIDYKDSPIDKGKKVFEQMYKNRYFISDVSELEEMIK